MEWIDVKEKSFWMISAFSLFVMPFFLSCGGYRAWIESEHFISEFWQREDGKYCVRISQYDAEDGKVTNSVLIFDRIDHYEEFVFTLDEALSL